jgi:succinate dehydrogenase / fumarate reductase cytochrome b subunit
MMPARARPISPHLQIYRWQIGNSLSILHRLTGIALALGLLALCYWLISLAGGERSYAAASRALASPLGLLLLVGWTFAFLYHLLNGVRHLFWDMGFGFERTQRRASGWFAVLGSIVLTISFWILIWAGHRA